MKVLLLNVPWYNGDLFGVRAGSRWPHIKIKEEGAYMPYPFFLGYSMSLLKKNDFEVSLIDALANKIKKDEDIYKYYQSYAGDHFAGRLFQRYT